MIYKVSKLYIYKILKTKKNVLVFLKFNKKENFLNWLELDKNKNFLIKSINFFSEKKIDVLLTSGYIDRTRYYIKNIEHSHITFFYKIKGKF